MQSRLSKALILAMILLLVSTLISCRTTKDARTIEIPELHIDVEKPTLEEIPQLDIEGWTDSQIQAVTDVLTAYNVNLGRLAIYAQSLEKTYKVRLEYLNNILTIITSSY